MLNELHDPYSSSKHHDVYVLHNSSVAHIVFSLFITLESSINIIYNSITIIYLMQLNISRCIIIIL